MLISALAGRRALRMKTARRAASMPQQQQQRFCWRERTERLNWRLLRALHLPDIVRRGDPTLLEPYVLHLTFARLPAGASTVASMDASLRGESRAFAVDGGGDDQQRSAWFIVRIFQLATEYLLFMRSRDGTVLETLQKELVLCEKECEAFAARATKWKERSKSGDKQVQKLHQVLQNIAKLLQLQGATPSAVATIESLLQDMVPRQKRNVGRNQNDDEDEYMHNKRIKEARQCFYCGKMFASTEFLDKHHLRRHSGENKEFKIADSRSRKSVPKPQSVQESNLTSDSSGSGEKALRQILQQVEYALQDHQESLRSLAQQEAKKIEGLYEQLHVENQLAEQIKASRILAEHQVKEAQEHLDSVLQEKDDALTELNELKEQIQFLDLKRKMEFQAGVGPSLVPSANQNDMATVLEIKRLEQALAMVNSTLSESRIELAKMQQLHLTTLKDKQVLIDQLSESQNHVKRLEDKMSESSGVEGVPVVHKDCGSQTVASEARYASPQAKAEESRLNAETVVLKADIAVQTNAEVNATSDIEKAIQTSTEEEQLQIEPLAVQLPDSIAIEQFAVRDVPLPLTEAVSTSALPVAEQSEDGLAVISDYVYSIVAESAMDAVKNRAQKAVERSTLSTQSPSRKSFSSLATRKFLRSQYLHDEQVVQERIASQVSKFDQLSQRFGVPPKCNLLSNEHLQIVQQALHGHLEILPTDVLQRMIECEGSVNSIIEKEWVPREKTRQQALELLKVQTETKSQLNQDLVRQAMTAFSSRVDAATTDEQHQLNHPIEQREEIQVMAQIEAQESRDENHSLGPGDLKPLSQYVRPTQEEFKKLFSMKDLTVVEEERPLLVELRADTLDVQASEEAKAGAAENNRPTDGRSCENVELATLSHASSAVAEAHVVMKLVTVSPKPSPTKPEPVSTTQEQELAPEGPVVFEMDSKKYELSSLPASEHVAEQTVSLAADIEAEYEDHDYVRVELQAAEIDDVMHPASDFQEDGAQCQTGNEDQLHLRPVAVSSVSALPSDELDELEIVDIQSAPDATRSADRGKAVTQHELIISTETVTAGDSIREASDRTQLHSYRSFEFSASLVASSELSFQASIPSLEESDGSVGDLSASRTVDEVSQAKDFSQQRNLHTRYSVKSRASEVAIQLQHFEEESLDTGGKSILDFFRDDEATELVGNEGRSAASISTSSQQNSPNAHGPRYDLSATANVLNFSDDDDSDIEEVELT